MQKVPFQAAKGHKSEAKRCPFANKLIYNGLAKQESKTLATSIYSYQAIVKIIAEFHFTLHSPRPGYENKSSLHPLLFCISPGLHYL